MATLRFHLPKIARRTPPSGDAGTSAPAEYPSSSAGVLSIDDMNFYLKTRHQEAIRIGAALSAERAVERDLRKIVEGDGPLESGLTPSPSIDTDRLNKLLIEAAATMREQNDLFAAIGVALDRHFSGITSGYGTLTTISRLMGRQ